MPLVMMPALSPTMTEGKLAKWLVAEGDSVASGDVIAEIETDKALMEVEALDDGVLATIAVAEGSDAVKVGTVIAEILAEGEASELAAGGKTKTAAKSPKTGKAETASKASEASAKTAGEADGATAKTPPVKSPIAGDAQRIFISPLAKRLAGQHGIDIAAVQGTGPHGRIVKADIDKAMATGGATGGATVHQISPAKTLPPSRIPITPMRKTIAQRLQQSMRDAPHYYVAMDIGMDALIEARKAINHQLASTEAAVKVSINDMLIKCAAACLMRVPAVNTSWDGDHIIQHQQADIAVAVAIDGGLITPIVRAADRKPLTAVAREAADLIQKARSGRLQANEFTGGSFTISNLGMYGVKSFTAVINPPHAAILAVAAAQATPVVKDGQVGVASIMTATLSCDHRLVDGAVGAEWMAAFKNIVENPVLALAEL